jgi:hypothetical protein
MCTKLCAETPEKEVPESFSDYISCLSCFPELWVLVSCTHVLKKYVPATRAGFSRLGIFVFAFFTGGGTSGNAFCSRRLHKV